MFGKNWQTRWNDTTNYLNQCHPGVGLGKHIETLVPANQRKTISGQISLGRRGDGEDDPEYQDNTNQRKALRALLLCQRVYFSGDFWAKQSEAGPGKNVIALNGLMPAKWKTDSLAHWKIKSENQIKRGIEMFVADPSAVASDVRAVAVKGPPNGQSLPGNLTLSRDDHNTAGQGVICYVGVQGWLVKSGVVSMRWFMMNSAPNKEVGCDLLFGKGNEVWRGNLKDSDKARVRIIIAGIAAGSVVHIYSPNNYNWNGHWVISNGDGTICGVNNGEFESKESERGRAVQKNYTNHSTLFEQFWCYGGEGKDAGLKTAVMVVIDPMQLEERILAANQ